MGKSKPHVFLSSIVAAAAMWSVSAQAKTIWVDDNGSDASRAGISSYHRTINAGISAAAAGDTVNVLPGLYKEKVSINKSLTLQAMKDGRNVVNPNLSPDNSDWPVIIESSSGNAIETFSHDNITVRGFYIRKATFNGIHMAMGGGSYNFRDLCENVYVLGNKIENVAEDGIKVNQCNRVTIQGNYVNNWSLDRVNSGQGESEHGIDFVAVANSVIRNNKLGKGLNSMCVKGGSIHVLIESNNVVGPVTWSGVAAGEPSSQNWMFYSSYSTSPAYQAKYITIRNNSMPTGVTLWSCQHCTVVNNGNSRVSLTQSGKEQTGNVCISGSPIKNNGVTGPVRTSNCPTTWPGASKVQTSVGWDMRAGSGSLPPAPSGTTTPPPVEEQPSTPPSEAQVPLYTVTIQAEAGATTGFSAVDGGIYQASGANLSDPNSGARAEYAFAVPKSGDYLVHARVRAENYESDSFFVNVDSEPSADMIWDIPLTQGFADRTVAQRGKTGNRVFRLAAGQHRLIIRGREAGAVLDRVTIESVEKVDESDQVAPIPVTQPNGDNNNSPSVLGLEFEAEAGVLTSGFSKGNGTIYQASTQNLSDPAQGARATYRFKVDQAGSYRLRALVRAETYESDSFFVNIDAEPSATMIWDIPLTTGTEERVLSQRGSSGERHFDLSAGEHMLYIRGREPNAHLDAIQLELVSASSSEPVRSPASSAGCDGSGCHIYVEAEDGQGSGLVFETKSDGAASGGQYLSAKKFNYDPDAADSSSVETRTYTINVDRTADYYVWARIRAFDNLHNSVYVSIDGSAYTGQDLPQGSSFQWARLRGAQGVRIEAGSFDVKIKNRELQTDFDQIFVTSDPNKQP